MPGQLMFDQIISKYGATAKAKLSSPAITGARKTISVRRWKS
jgi:hypothetical protein